MSLTMPGKLSQVALALASLSAFGVGYLAGRHAKNSADQREIERLNAQLMHANEANMRVWMENYSERFRRPPDAPPAEAAQ